MASRNELGEIGDDGVLRNVRGEEIPVGLDEKAKQELLDRLEGPKVRHMPSERDAFFAAGGVLEPEPYKLEDSQPSGHVEDLKGDTDGKEAPSKGAPSKDTKK